MPKKNPSCPSGLPLTVLIAVKSEIINLRRCLNALTFAHKVIVIDSHSNDGTAELAQREGATVVQFDYNGGYPKKRQWALENLDILTPWVFLVDADEVVPDKLWQEIAKELDKNEPHSAFQITKGFHFLGRRFRYGGFSHSAVLLFKTGKAAFEQLDDVRTEHDMEVHERIIVQGTVGKLTTPLVHEDFKGLTAYIDRHNQYSTWEAAVRYHYLHTGQYGSATIKPRLFGNSQERRRFLKFMALRVPFEPTLWFLYHYIFRLGFLEGKPGLIASQIRATYISQVRAKIFELNQKDPYKRIKK
jgi:glycosyltransferase involved in cell wall biosynthesis